MANPCEKFQGLVVGPDGQTVADPYGWVPTLADYEEWREVALGIFRRIDKELEREKAVTGEADDTVLKSLRARWDDLGTAVTQSFSFNFTWGPSINKMVTLAQDAACELGQVEARTIAGGGGAASGIPSKPEGKKSWLDSAASLMLVVGVVGGLWWLSQKGREST